MKSSFSPFSFALCFAHYVCFAWEPCLAAVAARSTRSFIIAQFVNFGVNAALRQFGKYRIHSGEISKFVRRIGK